MKKENMKFIVLPSLFIISLFLISWSDQFMSMTDVNDDICFERDVLPVFTNNCALSGCHDSEGRKDGLILDNYDNIMASKKGRAIIPFDLKKSKVYKKITEDSPEDRMPPPPHPALTGTEITSINRWIMSGALNSKCDMGSTIPPPGEITVVTECDTLNITYKSIQPVIEKNCYKCHSGNEPGDLFNLETYEQVKSKGTDGSLKGAVNHLDGFKKMPAKAPKLTGCDLDVINAWINQGMKE